jgi:hypothetical protein
MMTYSSRQVRLMVSLLMCVFKENARVKGNSFEYENRAEMFMDRSDSGSPRAECCCGNDSL